MVFRVLSSPLGALYHPRKSRGNLQTVSPGMRAVYSRFFLTPAKRRIRQALHGVCQYFYASRARLSRRLSVNYNRLASGMQGHKVHSVSCRTWVKGGRAAGVWPDIEKVPRLFQPRSLKEVILNGLFGPGAPAFLPRERRDRKITSFPFRQPPRHRLRCPPAGRRFRGPEEAEPRQRPPCT